MANNTASAPAAAGEFLGVPAGFWLLGIGAAAAVAYLTSGSSDAPATPGTTLPVPTPGAGSSSTPPSPTGSVVVKPTRPAVVQPTSPLKYVFIDSFNGETCFERLASTPSTLYGYGLASTNIMMLNDKEFAGWDTGRRYQPNKAYPEMMQVCVRFANGKRYNFWVEAAQTRTFLSVAAAQAAGFLGYMYDTHAADLESYYASRYAS